MRIASVSTRRFFAVALAAAGVVAFVNLSASALAQDLAAPNLLPPPPPPPPPPAVYVPDVPVFGEVQQPRNVKPIPEAQPSFGDRATQCLDEAAARGVKPGDRAAYVGSCANR